MKIVDLAIYLRAIFFCKLMIIRYICYCFIFFSFFWIIKKNIFGIKFDEEKFCVHLQCLDNFRLKDHY